jgi:enoyl-CoA hydratase/carnithine racemase
MGALLSEERAGSTARLVLARPPSNVLSLALLRELTSKAKALGQDPAVRSIVLVSALPKYFSSGLDLDEMHALPAGDKGAHFKAIVELHRTVAAVPKPTVAALSGSALLGGFILSLACDYRLLGEGARVSLSEVRLGLSPTTALVRLVSRLSSSQSAIKSMVLEGKPLRSEEALAAGLVDAVHPPEAVEAEAMRLAERLGRSAPKAYASVKRSLRRAWMGDEDAVWKESLSDFSVLFAGAEAQEGLAAAREKRKPRWEA